jgi:hypothetical protein
MKGEAINAKFLPWELVEFHKQTEEYFVIFRKLSSMGLNLRLGITNKHVTIVDIKIVFGLDCSSLKTMNLNLHLNTKQGLVKFYWYIYGSMHITNNDFMF